MSGRLFQFNRPFAGWCRTLGGEAECHNEQEGANQPHTADDAEDRNHGRLGAIPMPDGLPHGVDW